MLVWKDIPITILNKVQRLRQRPFERLANLFEAITGQEVTYHIRTSSLCWFISYRNDHFRLSLQADDADVLKLLDFGVTNRGQGMGTKLITAMQVELEALPFHSVALWAANDAAARFWRKIGFLDIYDERMPDGSMLLMLKADKIRVTFAPREDTQLFAGAKRRHGSA
ncbi:GNAT family N-acetyltransferase [Brevibacillus dissolubilis]|uniref:GNAT family N-acetyltransferase n=1 Tax=Brevibacillus dissolubilis TaxID=1844116 RepID=UPI0011170091|nr:GNAT family N-acetyltransferase [Brevibacillus dissolubilis]